LLLGVVPEITVGSLMVGEEVFRGINEGTAGGGGGGGGGGATAAKCGDSIPTNYRHKNL